jgi:uncharacterized protein (DUF2236 family)
MKTTKRITNRRNFLLAAGLGGAGAAVAVATGVRKPEKRVEAEAAKPTGYHASEHVLKYYKTTEV